MERKLLSFLTSGILSSCIAFSQIPSQNLVLDVDFERQIVNTTGSAITMNVTGNTNFKEAITKKDNHSFYFDGSSYISINNPDFSFGQGANKGLTVSFWYKQENRKSTKSYGLLSQAKTNWTGSVDFDYFIGLGASDGLIFATGPSTAGNTAYTLTNNFPLDNTWHHLAMTLDQTGVQSGKKVIYIDGVEVFNSNYTVKGSAKIGDLILGKTKTASTNELFEGEMDALRIYETALDSNEVIQLFEEFDFGNPLLMFSKQCGLSSNGVYGKDITISGNPTLAQDRQGNNNSAFYLDGVDDFITIDGGNLDFGRGADKEFTLSMWVKQENVAPSNGYVLLSKASTGWSGSSDFDYGIAVNNSNGIIPFTGPSTDAGNYPTNIFTPVANEWYHLVMTVNQTGQASGEKIIYVDGLEIFRSSYSSKGTSKNGDLIIGKGKATNPLFKGWMDDIEIFSKSFTQNEVTALFQSTTTNKNDGVILNLGFDNSIDDVSKFDNNVNSSNITFGEDRHGNLSGAAYYGDNSTLTVDHNACLNFGTGAGKEFTLSMWVKQDKVAPVSGYALLTKASPNWTGSSEFDYGAFVARSTGLFPFTGPSSDAVNYPSTLGYFPMAEEWYHLVMTVDQTGQKSGEKTIYINGTEVLNANYSNKGTERNGDIIFGRGKSGFAVFEGYYDDVIILNRTISSAEVQSLFNSNTVTSIDDFRKASELGIFPNPATNILNTKKGLLEIVDALGNTKISTESTGQVDVSSLESGVYFVTQNEKRTKLIIE